MLFEFENIKVKKRIFNGKYRENGTRKIPGDSKPN